MHSNPVDREDLDQVGEDDAKLIIGQEVALLELLHVDITENRQVMNNGLL